jgi:hypothetical protein
MVSSRSSRKEKTRTLVGTQLIPSLQQCSHAHGTVCPDVSVTYGPDLSVTYGPDLSSGDIFLFPNLDGSLIRHQFESVEEIQEKHYSS